MRTIFKGFTGLYFAMCIVACDDNTSDLGIYSQSDGITNSTAMYEVKTRSMKMDSVVANSTVCYIGRITDPETGADISAEFAAQFYTFENYQFPPLSQMIGDVDGTETQGKVQCDSCEVRLYFDDFYGDADNPMKIEVYALSGESGRIMEEDSVYYTDTDLTQFLPDGARPIASRIFTPKDYNLDATTLSSSSYDKNVRIMLPPSFGKQIMDKYYENPTNFKDSYHFIRNVFPGLLFKTTNGKGSMLSVYVGTLNIYYRYADTVWGDTIYNGITRFAATPEVIQSTHFDNQYVTSLIDDTSCTYLKTPAGICTELTLPIDEIFANGHATDSVSLANITLTRYNKIQDKYQLDAPSTLLLVRKQEMHRFFANHSVADGRTSYITNLDESYNTYTFSNVCRLIAYCKHEKAAEAQKAGISEEDWATLHPDWNKVVVIPVLTSSNSSGALVSVTHDLNLNSIRLVGGDTKIKMQVVYSKFYQE